MVGERNGDLVKSIRRTMQRARLAALACTSLAPQRRMTAKRKRPAPHTRAKSRPHRSGCALLLVDVINDMAFEGGSVLLEKALPAAKKLAQLLERARKADIPIIYANDNFGHWRSDFNAIVRHCLDEDVPGRAIAELLAPDQTDYFVLKPKHSAFFSTALDTLLRSLGTHTLILAGFAGDICVLFTAHDAHMREYKLFVPADCIASEDAASNTWALEHMRRFLRVDTRLARTLDLAKLGRARPHPSDTRMVTR